MPDREPTLFDDLPEAARRSIELAKTLDPNNPFGDTRPEATPATTARNIRTGRRKARSLEQTVGDVLRYNDPEFSSINIKPAQPTATGDHALRARNELIKDGWDVAWNAEASVVTEMGAVKTVDMLGFIDVMAIRAPISLPDDYRNSGLVQVKVVQITTPKAVRAHIRKMAHPDSQWRKSSVRKFVEAFLRMGIAIEIWDYSQPGGSGTHWQHGVLRVTSDMLEAADARRRGPKK